MTEEEVFAWAKAHVQMVGILFLILAGVELLSIIFTGCVIKWSPKMAKSCAKVSLLSITDEAVECIIRMNISTQNKTKLHLIMVTAIDKPSLSKLTCARQSI